MTRIARPRRAPRQLRDHYEVLGLAADAHGAEVGAAYWQLARQYHSLASRDATALVLLEELNAAAEVLGTPASRHQYDILREAALVADRAQRTAAEDAPSTSIGEPAAARPARVGIPKRLALLVVILGVVGLASTAAATNVLVPGASVTSAPVIFLGDSVTDGVGASSGDMGFAALLRQRLDGSGFATAPVDYDSVISALGGQVVDLRFSQAIGREPRSLIVVEVGAHSVIEDAGLSSSQFGIGYGLMLDCLQGSGATIVVSTVPWLGWDGSDPAYALASERSQIIREEAAARGIPVADLWRSMRGRRDLLSDDGFHPNDAGHRLAADLFWLQISSLLTRPRGEFHNQCGYDGVLALRSAQAEVSARGVAGG